MCPFLGPQVGVDCFLMVVGISDANLSSEVFTLVNALVFVESRPEMIGYVV